MPYDSPTRSVFTYAGMIHLMVVSGAHLLFLERMWSVFPKIKIKSFLVFLSLVVYALTAGLHPPVVRALMSFFVYRFSKRFNLFWSSQWRIMISGILSLSFNPAWVFSTSLQMSWIGALAFSFSKHSKILSCFLCYIFLLPIIGGWTTLHPLSVGINWMLFPIVSTVLFPLSVLSFIFPWLYPVASFLWSMVIEVLTFLGSILEKPPLYAPWIAQKFVWIYIGVLFTSILGIKICLRRN